MSTFLPLASFPCKPSTNKPFNSKPSFNTRTNRTQIGFRVSCNITPPNSDNDENQLILPEQQKLILPINNNNVDRRNLLVGLGGLYTAANLPAALAAPITTPDDIWDCDTAVNANDGSSLAGGTRGVVCCAPRLEKKVKNFKFPDRKEKVRMRWPAHKGTDEQIKDYKDAIQAMKNLDPKHPHSFQSQAKIHCAYCNGGYPQPGADPIQIHGSWLFFPFHRWYLYFYERILGKLINKPDFALPYWNWDNPEAGSMVIPDIFLGDEINPLWDVYRNEDHLPPTLVDLNYSPPAGGTIIKRTRDEQIRCNLRTMYKELVSNATNADDFFGSKYVAGKNVEKPRAGSVENGSHTAIHVFVGDPKQPFNEDMGNFYSAGYDPLFYIHHANVDRTWKLWKDLKGKGPRFKGHTEPRDKDWLNASYVFYDENEELVRVYNKDAVDLDKLKYNYQSQFKIEDVLPSRPTQRSKTEKGTSFADVKTLSESPVTLDKIYKVRVKRPKVNRTPEEKLTQKEVLTIGEIKFGGDEFVKFEVFVNDNVEDTRDGEKPKYPDVCSASYAGAFARISHGDMREMRMTESNRETNSASFVLTELFEDTKTDDQEEAVVAFVPRTGCKNLTISGIKIELKNVLL